MAQTAHDITPIREAVAQGRFDVAERLVREALALVMPADPAEGPLKVLLAGLIAKRGILQARDSLFAGNGDAARKTLRKTYKQLDHEGINGKGTIARNCLERAALPLDDPDLTPEQYDVIVSEVIGPRQFLKLLDELPDSLQAVEVEAVTYNPEFQQGSEPQNDSLITRIFARKRKHEGAGKTVEEIVEPTRSQKKTNTQKILQAESTSVAEVLLAALLRPRVIGAALMVFFIVAALGFLGREQNFVSNFSLLRDTKVDEGSGSFSVSVLPKEQLGRLPRQSEIVGPLGQILNAEFTDHKNFFQIEELTRAITSTVDTGDRNSRDFGLNVSFKAPTEPIAKRGAEALMELIRERHSNIVMQRVDATVTTRRTDHAQIKEEIQRLTNEISELAGTGFASIGTFEVRVELLNKLLVESKLAVERAQIDAAASETRASKVDEGFELEPETQEKRTEELLSSTFWALQPLYSELTSRWDSLRKMELEIKNRDYGEGHEMVREAKSLRENIKTFENEVVALRNELSTMTTPRIEEVRNTVYERLKVESALGLADREAAKASVTKAQTFFDSISKEIQNLKLIEELDKDLKAQLVREAQVARDLYALEDYIKTQPGALGTISEVDKPTGVSTSMMMILLAAIGLGLVAGTIAALTGGQRTLQISLLSVLVALFQLRP